MKCKDCAFYKDSKDPSAQGMYCSNLKLAAYKDSPDDDGLVAQYPEYGSFKPGPEFGCVHHSLIDAEVLLPAVMDRDDILSIPIEIDPNKHYIVFANPEHVYLDDLVDINCRFHELTNPKGLLNPINIVRVK